MFNVTLAAEARSFSAFGVPPVSARSGRHMLYATSIYGSESHKCHGPGISPCSSMWESNLQTSDAWL